MLHRPIKLIRSLTPAEEAFFEEAEDKGVLFSFDESGAPFVEMPAHTGKWFTQELTEASMPHLESARWSRYQLKDPKASVAETEEQSA